MIELKVKKLDDKAVLPSYATDGSNGLDLTALSINPQRDKDGDNHLLTVHTGLSIEIPEGYVGLIFPRSSISNKPFSLANAVGVIDSDYRGEITFKFRYNGQNHTNWTARGYDTGDRVGQLLLVEVPKVQVVEVESLEETTRGSGGYGSTGQ